MKYRPRHSRVPAVRLLPAAPLLMAMALLAPPASAQPTLPAGLPDALAAQGAEVAATAPAVVIDNDERALMLAFGHRAGLARLADAVVDRLAADPRYGTLLRDAPPAQVKQRMAEQFCQALRGPCGADGTAQRSGADHAVLRQADFTALTALLQASMTAQAVPPAAQDALLARLAPAQRRVVLR